MIKTVLKNDENDGGQDTQLITYPEPTSTEDYN